MRHSSRKLIISFCILANLVSCKNSSDGSSHTSTSPEIVNDGTGGLVALVESDLEEVTPAVTSSFDDAKPDDIVAAVATSTSDTSAAMSQWNQQAQLRSMALSFIVDAKCDENTSEYLSLQFEKFENRLQVLDGNAPEKLIEQFNFVINLIALKIHSCAEVGDGLSDEDGENLVNGLLLEIDTKMNMNGLQEKSIHFSQQQKLNQEKIRRFLGFLKAWINSLQPISSSH